MTECHSSVALSWETSWQARTMTEVIELHLNCCWCSESGAGLIDRSFHKLQYQMETAEGEHCSHQPLYLPESGASRASVNLLPSSCYLCKCVFVKCVLVVVRPESKPTCWGVRRAAVLRWTLLSGRQDGWWPFLARLAVAISGICSQFVMVLLKLSSELLPLTCSIAGRSVTELPAATCMLSPVTLAGSSFDFGWKPPPLHVHYPLMQTERWFAFSLFLYMSFNKRLP